MKRAVRFLSLVVSFSLLLSGTAFAGDTTAAAPATGAGFVLYGDSRAVGIAHAIGMTATTSEGENGAKEVFYGYLGDNYIYAKGSQGVKWAKTGVKESNGILSTKAMVFWLGVNSLGDSNAKKYVDYINGQASSLPNKIYVAEVTPCFGDEADKNTEIQEFNTYLKSNLASNVTVIPLYTAVEALGADISSDGVHYNNDAYTNIWSQISSAVGGGGAASGTGQSASGSGGNPYAESNATDAFTVALKEWLGVDKILECDRYDWSFLISAVKADGITNEKGIAALMGNMKQESAGHIYAIEGYDAKKTISGETYAEFRAGQAYDYGDTKGDITHVTLNSGATGEIYGVGLGIVQWSLDRGDAFSAFSESNFSTYGGCTVQHWRYKTYKEGIVNPPQKVTSNIVSMPGQVQFMIEEFHTTQDGAKSILVNAADIRDATIAFEGEYEGSADGAQGLDNRVQYAEEALPVIQAFQGVVGVSESGAAAGTDPAGNFADAMKQAGYWSEDELSAWARLSEINVDDLIDDLSREMLNQNDLNGLAQWERNVQSDIDANGLIPLLRRIITFVGILLMVWMVVWYLAYWFDRTVSFMYIDLLGIVSFGMLHMSDNEDESTFGLGKEGRKTVNHKTILVICLTGIAFGVLLVTGTFYRIIGLLVQWMKRLLRYIGGIF